MPGALAYIRGTCRSRIGHESLAELAGLIARGPAEVLLTGRGATTAAALRSGAAPEVAGRAAAAALARRNIRSLLARRPVRQDILSALAVAVGAGSLEAQDALEDAGLEMNLRYVLHAAPQAELRMMDRDLHVRLTEGPGRRVARRELRDRAADVFCPEALARLVSSDIEAVVCQPEAVLPLPLQLDAGGWTGADSAWGLLLKGRLRDRLQPDFMKEYCVACGRCYIYCPENAVIHAMLDPGSGDTTGVLGIDFDRCTGCGLCAAVCPTNRAGYRAIVMIEHGREEAAAAAHKVA